MARDSSIDLMKFIGIIAVIMGHIATPYTQFIFLWHMPLFMFLSGFFLSPQRSFIQNIQKSFIRLILPFVAFSVLAILIEYLKCYILSRPSADLLPTIEYSFFWINSSQIKTYGFALWFLPALFFSRSIALLLIRTFQKLGGKYFIHEIVLLTLSILGSYFVVTLKLHFPFGIGQAIIGLPYLVLGYAFSKNKEKLAFTTLIRCLLAFMLILITYIISRNNLPQVDIGSFRFTPYVLALVVSMSICLALFFISQNLDLSFDLSLFSKLSSCFMMIYLVHPYTNNVAYILANKYMTSFGWEAKLILSLLLVVPFCVFKVKYNNNTVLKYV